MCIGKKQILSNPLTLNYKMSKLKESNHELLISKISKTLKEDRKWIFDNLIFLSVTGSRLYGTSNDNSDIDYIGVTLSPIDYWIGNKNFDSFRYKSRPAIEVPGDIDLLIYDVRHFIKLLSKNNPNVIELLCINLDNKNIIIKTDLWKKFVAKRGRFLSKNIEKSFKGFFNSQLYQLKNKKKPSRIDSINERGYDTKGAYHYYRIVSEYNELLKYGTITFPRPEAKELLEIKQGKLKTKEECFQFLEKKGKTLLDINNYNIEDELDYKWINSFQINIFKDYIYNKQIKENNKQCY